MKLFTAITVLFFVTKSFAANSDLLNNRIQQLESLKTKITQKIKDNNIRVGLAGAAHIDANYTRNLETDKERIFCGINSSRNFIAPHHWFYGEMSAICRKNSIIGQAALCKVINEVAACKIDVKDAQAKFEETREIEFFNLDNAQKQSIFFFRNDSEQRANSTANLLLSTYKSLDTPSQELFENKSLIHNMESYGTPSELQELLDLMAEAKSILKDISDMSKEVSEQPYFQRLKTRDLIMWASFFRVTVLTLELPIDAKIEITLRDPWRMKHLPLLNPPRYMLTVNGIESSNSKEIMKIMQLAPKIYTILE